MLFAVAVVAGAAGVAALEPEGVFITLGELRAIVLSRSFLLVDLQLAAKAKKEKLYAKRFQSKQSLRDSKVESSRSSFSSTLKPLDHD